ncbi:hypothetical protein C4565_02490 [Candidatus Parcubacteria bacterium]|jgi:hypothetical protein|nr:MAG: hypothetical protein C4565_02490 [Candidatus Parcubacteria bacterium]
MEFISLLFGQTVFPHIIWFLTIIAIIIFGESPTTKEEKSNIFLLLIVFVVVFLLTLLVGDLYLIEEIGMGSYLTGLFSMITGFMLLGWYPLKYPKLYPALFVISCIISVGYAFFFGAWLALFGIAFGVLVPALFFLLVC